MSTTSKAGQRITALLDDNSFVEIGAGVTARATDFNLKQTETPSDGVITGYGVIDGNLVYVYSQDASVLGGSVGEMHAKKIVNLYELAMKTGAPVIGLIDSAGMRLQESTDALYAFGEIYKAQAMASGVILQISAVFGSCGGGLALIPGLTDFTFMEGSKGKLFVNAPNALEGNHEGKCNSADAAFQSAEAGLVDVTGEEGELLAQIRELVCLLPANNEDNDSYEECLDDLNRSCDGVENLAQDGALVLEEIADDHRFFEIKASYGRSMAVGLIRLNGMTVGAVANRAVMYDEEGKVKEQFNALLSAEGCQKAADFVRFCDAFHIPVLTLTNAVGFEATLCAEKKIARAAARLTYELANATVPKVNVVIGKAFGSAYVVMNSKGIGADITIAWPDAQIGSMEAGLAAGILCDGQGADAIRACAQEYEALQLSVQSAARRGYVDQMAEPQDTRKYVIGAFEMLFTKREDRPSRKHGTV